MAKLRIKQLCAELRVTQAQLAEKLGVTAGAVSQILNESTTPSLKSLERIATVLGVSIRDLFEDDNVECKQQNILGVIMCGKDTYTVRNENDYFKLENSLPGAVQLQYFAYPSEAEKTLESFMKTSVKKKKRGAMMGRIGIGTVFSVISQFEYIDGKTEESMEFLLIVNTANRGLKVFRFSEFENINDLDYMFNDAKASISINYQDNEYGESLLD